jgi:cell division protein FtsQ
MARRSGATIQEELYSTPEESGREELGDVRLIDLDGEKESPFLRAQKRVSVRRTALPKKTATRLLWAVVAIAVAAVTAVVAATLYHYGEHSWRFRVNSSDDIEITGLSNITRSQVIEVMGGDIGRNVFFIPLDRRQKQLEQIPWVESASVMRFAPNRLGIQIQERTPVAFARAGSKIMLVDSGGVLMELSTKRRYSFPVIEGISSSEPLSTRAEQMKIYNQLIRELDSGGGRYSSDLSEVDLSDPEDVKVLTNDPDGEVLVHLGSSNYLDRFKVYVAHLREWRQQFQKLESVDLRYDRQIIVNPDLRGTVRQPPLSAAAARAAISAGVKPTALRGREPASMKSPPAKAGLSHHQISSAVSQKGSKEAASPGKRSPKSRWVRHNALPKKAHVATGGSLAPSSVTRPTTARALGKPSPAIPKGQESR